MAENHHLKTRHNVNLCHAMLCKRGLCCHAVSVCLPVCLSHSHILSKRTDIFRIFLPSGNHTILLFPHQMGWRYSGIKCRWGRQKWQFQAYTWSGSLPAINAATGQVLSTRPAVDHGDRPASYDTYIAGCIMRECGYWTTKHLAQ